MRRKILGPYKMPVFVVTRLNKRLSMDYNIPQFYCGANHDIK
jgi:hypothetical protein